MARKKKEETIVIENVETIENLEKEETKETQTQYKVIAAGGLRVRENATLESMVIDVLKFGTIVVGSEIVNDFVKVENGYMLKEFLEEV